MATSDWITLLAALAPIVLAGLVGGVGWALRANTKTIMDAITAVGKDVARLEGRLHYLEEGLGSASNTMAGVSAELKAVWRFIDGANERASDVFGRR